MPICSVCGSTKNRTDARFCSDCGAPLDASLLVVCKQCGARNLPRARFCSDCATPMRAAVAATPGETPAPSAIPAPPSAPVRRRAAPPHDPQTVQEFIALCTQDWQAALDRFREPRFISWLKGLGEDRLAGEVDRILEFGLEDEEEWNGAMHEWIELAGTRLRPEMVPVPAGEFVMGTSDLDDACRPPHRVFLDDYSIGKYPVTNAQYKLFVDATGYETPLHWEGGVIPEGKENHPVVNVDWDDAVAYAKWAGMSLPSEAEWEKAASWDAARDNKRDYPWGDHFDPELCNSSGIVGDTTAVGTYSPRGDSPYGVADMAGNVWEWCYDWFDEHYYRKSPDHNPEGPEIGDACAVRGGSWYDDAETARSANRDSEPPGNFNDDIGFRVVE